MIRQEFVYLFAPLRHLLKEADLQNFRLENGLKIWPALWDYRHPNAACFTTPVRPRKNQPAVRIRDSSRRPLLTAASPAAGASSAAAQQSVFKEALPFSDVFIGAISPAGGKIGGDFHSEICDLISLPDHDVSNKFWTDTVPVLFVYTSSCPLHRRAVYRRTNSQKRFRKRRRVLKKSTSLYFDCRQRRTTRPSIR